MAVQLALQTLLSVIIDIAHIIKTLILNPISWLWEAAAVNEDAVLDEFFMGKTVLVTGASSGIGRALALQLYGKGAHLVLTARSKDKLNICAKDCLQSYPNASGKVMVVCFDLENHEDEIDSFATKVNEALDKNGVETVDVVINNAGVSSRGAALDAYYSSLGVLNSVMDTNFFGPVAVTMKILPRMLKSRRKCAVAVVSSVQGKLGIPFRTSYAASKHAVQGFFDCLRAELAPKNITVTLVSPGYVNTALSLNAVTADGSKYGQTDITTAKGMSPDYVARRIMLAVAKGQSECLLADAKTCAAVQFRQLFPDTFSKIIAVKKG